MEEEEEEKEEEEEVEEGRKKKEEKWGGGRREKEEEDEREETTSKGKKNLVNRTCQESTAAFLPMTQRTASTELISSHRYLPALGSCHLPVSTLAFHSPIHSPSHSKSLFKCYHCQQQRQLEPYNHLGSPPSLSL